MQRNSYYWDQKKYMKPVQEYGIHVCINADMINGVGTNFGVGGGEARPEESRAGGGVWGGDSQPLSGVQGRFPATEGFSCIRGRQIVFTSISVRVAYSLYG